MTVTTGVAITSLPAATLPLTGTEAIPLMQGGVAKQAPPSAFGGSGAVSLTTTVPVALAAGDNNNLLVVGLAAANRLLCTPAGDANLSGIQGGAEGQLLLVQNLSAVFSITLLNESGLSVAGNRIVGSFGGDVFIPPLGAALLLRDLANVNRWVKT